MIQPICNGDLWYPKTIYQWRYEPNLKERYQSGDRKCDLWNKRWLALPVSLENQAKVADAEENPKLPYWKAFGGRIASSKGEFPAVFVREEFRRQKYTVWGSEPRLISAESGQSEGFVLLSFCDHRRNDAECYANMLRIFGKRQVADLNDEADRIKKEMKGSTSGGDPDLFIFNRDNPTDRFFVEVKDRGDKLAELQKVCFGLIEKYLKCEVRLCCVASCDEKPFYRLS
jgi:hypothetical protein